MQTAHNEPDAQSGHVTPREVAAQLGVHPSTIRRHAARLGAIKPLGRWRLDPARIRTLLTGGA